MPEKRIKTVGDLVAKLQTINPELPISIRIVQRVIAQDWRDGEVLSVDKMTHRIPGGTEQWAELTVAMFNYTE